MRSAGYRAVAEALAEYVAASRGRFDDSNRLQVLDLAVGAGHLLLYVEALNLAPSMTCHGLHEDVAALADLYGRERWRAAVAGPDGPLPYPTASMDAVVCHHLPSRTTADPERVMAEAARVLKPGGLLLVTADVVPRFLTSSTPPTRPAGAPVSAEAVRQWVTGSEAFDPRRLVPFRADGPTDDRPAAGSRPSEPTAFVGLVERLARLFQYGVLVVAARRFPREPPGVLPPHPDVPG